MWTWRWQEGELDDVQNTIQKAPTEIPQLKIKEKNQSYAQKTIFKRKEKNSQPCAPTN